MYQCCTRTNITGGFFPLFGGHILGEPLSLLKRKTRNYQI